MSRPQLLLLSSSSVHGYSFLDYAKTDIKQFVQKSCASTILFIPYAGLDYDAYVDRVREAIAPWGFQVESIHTAQNPIKAIKTAEAIFVGGGNTFLLLKRLYDRNMLKVIRERVLDYGVPYIGSSAGSNIAGPCIHTTNDMPIVYPPSFNALNLIPFNLNPHYSDPNPNPIDCTETRDERILQYHSLPQDYRTYNVLGLREGGIINVHGGTASLKGISGARLFVKGQAPQNLAKGSDLTFLFDNINTHKARSVV